jgi:hypothetical protein
MPTQVIHGIRLESVQAKHDAAWMEAKDLNVEI